MRISDWSSDVCSSDLGDLPRQPPAARLKNLTQRREGAKKKKSHTKTQRCRLRPRHRAFTRSRRNALPAFVRPSNEGFVIDRRPPNELPPPYLFVRLPSIPTSRLCSLARKNVG